MRHRRDTRGKPNKGWRELGLGMRMVLRKPRRRRGLTLPETKGSSREHRKKDTMGRDRERMRGRVGREGRRPGMFGRDCLGTMVMVSCRSNYAMVCRLVDYTECIKKLFSRIKEANIFEE